MCRRTQFRTMVMTACGLSMAVVLLLLQLGTPPSSAADDAVEFGKKHGDYFNLLFYNPSDFSLSYSDQPTEGRNKKETSTTFNTLKGELDLVYPLSEDSGIAAFTTYEQKEFHFEKSSGSDPMPVGTNVHLLTVDTAIGTFFSPDLVAGFVFEPSLASDFESFDRKDLQLFFGPLASYRVSPNLAYQAGLFESTSVYHRYTYPIIGFSYRSPDLPWRANIALPSYARLGYFLSDRTELFGSMMYSYEEYHVRLGDPGVDSNIRVNQARVGSGGTYTVTRALLLTLEGGVVLGTRYRGIAFDGGEFDGNFDPSVYVSAGIGVRLY